MPTHKQEFEKGKLFLIPSRLGEQPPLEVLPLSIRKKINDIDTYIAENEKVTRAFIKKIVPGKPQSDLTFFLLNKFTKDIEIPAFLDPCKNGKDVGMVSDAGCPGIADPGSQIVNLAHQYNIKVVPLVGPSSILLALMASGMNGQNFAFNGYLPIDKSECKSKIKQLEKRSIKENQSQVFIETPYRNDQMFELLLKTLQPNTKLCIGCELTLSTEYIQTKSVSEWQNIKLDLHKKPCIFIIQQ
ncbi:SAM-dependent methyltransferase [Psychroflexus planctonicus]|uniref:S-adenosylmethionine-dependent methyltransferase n=1 Tax=Psychroflexus planctonicus TaxID=1526575 RepID=A0ABQ1SNG1_9FLAO|nr:SAM-dependent methyltransferase [Psychroflexus planctonicus]GGE44057.1 S-adenosylmethionine-dependent methyltransferase [Psychroflexus planctonicus]